MVEIGYRYSIAKYPVAIAEAEKLLESKEAVLASESEWKLALDQGVIFEIKNLRSFQIVVKDITGVKHLMEVSFRG